LHGDCSNPACINPAHLRWGSHLANIADRHRLGRDARLAGQAHALAKLTDFDVRAIRASTASYRELAKLYGVSFGLIGHVKRRRSWAHLD